MKWSGDLLKMREKTETSVSFFQVSFNRVGVDEQEYKYVNVVLLKKKKEGAIFSCCPGVLVKIEG